MIAALEVRNSMFFFGKKRKKEIDETVQKLEESHIRQVNKIEKTTELVRTINQALVSGKTRHITEAIAAATGALKR